MAFRTSAVTAVQLALAHYAVDVPMQSMAFRQTLAAVQLVVAHGAVDVLTQSMAFITSAVRLLMAHGAATCSRIRWHSDLPP